MLFTFNLTAQELESQAHAGRSGPLWVYSDETGQQGLHCPQLRSVVVAIPFKYLERGQGEEVERRRAGS